MRLEAAMGRAIEEFVSIGDHWLLVAFGIECAQDASLTTSEVDRVLQDPEADQVPTRTYEFRRQGRGAVLGVVDVYEPETLKVVGSEHRALTKALPGLVDRAGAVAAHRLEASGRLPRLPLLHGLRGVAHGHQG
jgi:hypothetical protein